ncbi:chloride channel protein 1-like [Chelonoidis abingdonii]|uniref:chloride channel protein 1-like n=1 Tax=Chelonoidis abingdonii TaxID=106734 RepID=UPI003F4962C1
MVTDLKYLPRGCRFKDVQGLLKASSLKQFPLVDSQESRILLGSIRKKHLAKLLSEQLSTEKRFQYLLRQSEANSPTEPKHRRFLLSRATGGHQRKRSEAPSCLSR